jgi:hypothetical protein
MAPVSEAQLPTNNTELPFALQASSCSFASGEATCPMTLQVPPTGTVTIPVRWATHGHCMLGSVRMWSCDSILLWKASGSLLDDNRINCEPSLHSFVGLVYHLRYPTTLVLFRAKRKRSLTRAVLSSLTGSRLLLMSYIHWSANHFGWLSCHVNVGRHLEPCHIRPHVEHPKRRRCRASSPRVRS